MNDDQANELMKLRLRVQHLELNETAFKNLAGIFSETQTRLIEITLNLSKYTGRNPTEMNKLIDRWIFLEEILQEMDLGFSWMQNLPRIELQNASYVSQLTDVSIFAKEMLSKIRKNV